MTSRDNDLTETGRQGIAYVLVGGGTALLELGLFQLLFELLKLPLAVSNVSATVVATAVNFLLKAPFPSDFLNSGTMAALLVRAARYAVIAFLEFGVYPMAFARVEGFLFKNKNQASVSA